MGFSINDAPLASACRAGQSVATIDAQWAKGLLIAGICVGLIALTASAFVQDAKLQRRSYWLGWLFAAVCFALAVLPRGWPGSVAIGILALFAAVLYAYFRTPFLKIRGRVYTIAGIKQEAASDTDQQVPVASANDSYPTAMGPVPARNVWWVLVALTLMFSLGVYLVGWTWQMILGAAFLAVLGALTGIDDGTRKLRIARGQHVQAYIVLVASILLWLAPPICYYLGYRVGQRWPMGRGRHAGHPPDA